MRGIRIKKGPSLTIILLLLVSLFNQGISTDQAVIDKEKGVNFTSWSADQLQSADSDVMIKEIRSTGADWISLVVTQYQANINSVNISPGPSTPTDASLGHAIETAHSLGMKVMIKPHVDLSDDPNHWRADIGLGFNDQDWQEWFDSYRHMILHYAKFAQEYKVDQMSIGTELEQTTSHAGEWREIVTAVRHVYSGPLTYSANHSGEEFFLSWWNVLDFIGVDAYYPLSVRQNPTLTEMELAWQQFILGLRGLYNTWHKPILFTELGYRSAAGAAKAPYEWGGNDAQNLEEQALAYQAFFNQVYWQPWFGGVFFWNYEPTPYTSGECGTDYTPYEKPAEKVLRAGFGGLPSISLPALKPNEDLATQVFNNGIQPGWRDTSWAETEVNGLGPLAGAAITTAFSGGNYLRVSANPGDAYALSVDGKPLDAGNYQWLELVIQAETDHQDWSIQMVDSHAQSARSLPVNNCRFVKGGQISKTHWTTAQVPLSSLLGSDKNITSIILSNTSGRPEDLWIQSIRLVPAGLP